LQSHRHLPACTPCSRGHQTTHCCLAHIPPCTAQRLACGTAHTPHPVTPAQEHACTHVQTAPPGMAAMLLLWRMARYFRRQAHKHKLPYPKVLRSRIVFSSAQPSPDWAVGAQRIRRKVEYNGWCWQACCCASAWPALLLHGPSQAADCCSATQPLPVNGGPTPACSKCLQRLSLTPGPPGCHTVAVALAMLSCTVETVCTRMSLRGPTKLGCWPGGCHRCCRGAGSPGCKHAMKCWRLLEVHGRRPACPSRSRGLSST
jgi:hypothetical protein